MQKNIAYLKHAALNTCTSRLSVSPVPIVHTKLIIISLIKGGASKAVKVVQHAILLAEHSGNQRFLENEFLISVPLFCVDCRQAGHVIACLRRALRTVIQMLWVAMD